MYQNKFKQITAAVLSAALVMGQAPTSYAAEDEEMLIIEDSIEDIESSDDEAFEEASDSASDDSFEELFEDYINTDDYDAASDEASEETELTLSEEDENDEAPAGDTLLPEGVVGMPEDYELTAEEKEFKEELAENTQALEAFAGMVEGVDYVSDQVICLADSQEHAEEIAAAYSGELESFEYGVAVIDLADSEVSIETAYSLAFDTDLNLPAVEPNYIYHLIGTADGYDVDTDDESSYFNYEDVPTVQSWEDVYGKTVNGVKFNDSFLSPTSHYYQWHHDMIHTYDAWKITTGGNHKVTVAVIDSGVQKDHPDLGGRVTVGMGGGDGNGHGTHVAGIIAATAGNGIGGSGIAPKASILSLQVLDANGVSSSDDAVLKAIRYVAGINSNNTDTGIRRADIANLSLGGPAYNQSVQQSINLATARGVTIIAAMGNELSNHTSYPAAYKNVIAVGAVNETGKRAYFSCYGSWQDISAPGTDITSCYPTSLSPGRYSGGKGYEVMDGTSQATPIVAGACALYMGYVGHVSPEKMQKALKASSNKGILNVGKLIKSAKPISTEGTVTGKKNVKSVSIQSTSNNAGYRLKNKNDKLTSATIYLDNSLSSITLKAVQPVSSGTAPNPSWTSSKKDVATVTGSGASATVTAVSKGKTTITCKAMDGSGKKASVTIIVAQGVTQVMVSGQTVVTPGSKVSYKATVYPTDASFKDVTYKLEKAYTGVHLNEKNGKVTIDSTAKPGSFKVIATSKDPGAKQGSANVTIKSAAATKASSVTLTKPSTTTIYTVAKNGLPTSVELKAKANNGTDITWKSSNDKVARLSANSGGSVKLKAVKAGTVKVTATANDGSKKKATITIKVGNPVSSLHLVAGGGTGLSLATGCSTTFKAVLGSAYGKPTNKKVNWTYEIYGRGNNGLEKLSSSAQNYCKQNGAFFTVNDKGKVTANSTSTFSSHVSAIKKYGASYSDYAVKVKATAADGSGTYSEKTLYKVNRNYYISFYVYNNGSASFYNSYYADKGQVGYIFVDANFYELAVESSNPQIANAYVTTVTMNNGDKRKVLRVDCKSRGTCNITVKTVDGSGVKGTFEFQVL
ncbi:S8 family serine peptidase [Butyrivibrio sp. MC2021]|uniref:S8 family serine peptidase n=1 Tax=Butyrivibrio sp. MC2021 TaxID=1408306 RepID=UPI0006857512|nr:S8 family serine peptidase [Butyrivibrio sp. MC2021]